MHKYLAVGRFSGLRSGSMPISGTKSIECAHSWQRMNHISSAHSKPVWALANSSSGGALDISWRSGDSMAPLVSRLIGTVWMVAELGLSESGGGFGHSTGSVSALHSQMVMLVSHITWIIIHYLNYADPKVITGTSECAAVHVTRVIIHEMN